MGRFPLLLLSVAILSSLLTFELARADREEAPLTEIAPLPVHLKISASNKASKEDIDAWMVKILVHPLFEKNRRPPEVPGQHVSSSPTLPRLSGTAIDASSRNAILVASKGAKPLVVYLGTSVGIWKVEAILPGEVHLSGPTGFQILHITHDNQRPEITVVRNAFAPPHIIDFMPSQGVLNTNSYIPPLSPKLGTDITQGVR